ncbi:hypothetical protein PM082_010186 [Marasmius tenuissimus]|nr:hypothetical protein PM082_010186 [Marasmius tenuissimus]
MGALQSFEAGPTVPPSPCFTTPTTSNPQLELSSKFSAACLSRNVSAPQKSRARSRISNTSTLEEYESEQHDGNWDVPSPVNITRKSAFVHSHNST